MLKRLSYQIKKANVLQTLYMRSSDKQYLTKVISVYESLIEKMPNNTTVLNNLAYTLADEDLEIDKALGYIKRVYVLDPINPGYLDTYGFVLYKNGKYEKAVRMLRSSVQQFEFSDQQITWDVYEHLAMAAEKTGEKQEAIEAYNKALKILDESGNSQNEQKKDELKNAIDHLSM